MWRSEYRGLVILVHLSVKIGQVFKLMIVDVCFLKEHSDTSVCGLVIKVLVTDTLILTF